MRFLIALAITGSLSLWSYGAPNGSCPEQLADYVLELDKFSLTDTQTAQLLQFMLGLKNGNKSPAGIARDLGKLKVPSPLGYQAWNEAAVASAINQAVKEIINNEDLGELVTQTRVICGLSRVGFSPGAIAGLFNRLNVPSPEEVKWNRDVIRKQITNHCQNSDANRDYFIQYPWRQPDKHWKPDSDLSALRVHLARDVFHTTLMKLKWHGLNFDEILTLLSKQEFSQLFTNVPLTKTSLFQTFVMNQKRVIANFLAFRFKSHAQLKSAIIALDAASLSPSQISLLLLEKEYPYEGAGEWTDQKVTNDLKAWLLGPIRGIHRISPLLKEIRFEAAPTKEFQAKINFVRELVARGPDVDWDLETLTTVFEVYAFLKFNFPRDEESIEMNALRHLYAAVKSTLIKKFEGHMYHVLREKFPGKVRNLYYREAALDGLLEAIEIFDYRHQPAWLAYSAVIIERTIIDAHNSRKNKESLVERTASCSSIDERQSLDFYKTSSRNSGDDHSKLHAAIAKLPLDEKTFILLRLADPSLSYDAIGEKMGKTRNQICYINTKAIANLKELLLQENEKD